MIARAVFAVTTLLSATSAQAYTCKITADELRKPKWIGAGGDEKRQGEVEIVGFVRSVVRNEIWHGGEIFGRPWVILVETIRTVRGERRPEWRLALRSSPTYVPVGRPDLGEGPYRFVFNLPETAVRDDAPALPVQATPPGSDAVPPDVGMRLCRSASVFPVSPYSPDVLLARAVGASAAPFVAGLSGLGLLAGAAAFLRRRWRRA